MLGPPVSAFELWPSELTQPFWDGARARRLLVQRCNACRRTFFRPEIACPHCLSQDWQWTESSGRGTVYSFSVVHRPPTQAFAVPFIFAVITLEEGWVMFSNLIGLEPEDARIGMAVEVTFHDLENGLTVPLFRPALAAP